MGLSYKKRVKNLKDRHALEHLRIFHRLEPLWALYNLLLELVLSRFPICSLKKR